ncbi:MAG: S9 family peptidase [Firmicutes bacterium HGW-Firmicutes-20]|nr:MAG: S9 family peptidase [Firmicutes bacterium HGW-Firmicutes-20]
MKKIMLDSWLELQFISNVKENPSNTKFAFVISKADLKKDTYENNIWVKEEKRYFQLTAFNQESFYIWLDDETILFSSGRQKDEQNQSLSTDFFKISCNGGEAVKLFSLPLIVTSIEVLNEGKFVLTALSDVGHPNYHEYSDEKKGKLAKKIKEDTFFDEITEVPFWANGAQLTNGKRNRLFVFDSKENKLTPITAPSMTVGDLTVNKQTGKVYYAADNFKNVRSLFSHLFELDLKDLIVTKLSSSKFGIYALQIANDTLYVLHNQRKTFGMSENPIWSTFDFEKKSLVDLCDPFYSTGNSIGSDVRLNGSPLIKTWNDKLLFTLTVEDHSRLVSLDSQGQLTTLFDAPGSIDGYAYINGEWYLSGLFNHNVQQLMKIENGGLVDFADFNDSYIKGYVVAKPQKISIISNNDTVDGWVLLPEDFDKNKLYPAILDIHGGPKTVYGEVYVHEMQVWAALGFVVMFCNPHGSDGKGNAFADIRGKYGTIDYEDILNFTDEVIKCYPNIDVSRIGVTGGSYGGFMPNWIIGHTDRFKCAATQRSICNWTSFHGVSDIGYFFTPDQAGASLLKIEQHDKLWFHSPLRYASNFKTPTLVIHSKADYRCPIDQGYQMITALKEMKVDSKMVVFNNENHDLSRNGKPKARQKRLMEITAWMEKYLK